MESTQQHPDSAHGDWKQIVDLLKQSRFSEVESLCRESAKMDKSGFVWRLGLALALLYRGEAQEALQQATQAAEMAPLDPRPYHIIAHIYVAQGNRRRAIDAALFGLRLAPTKASRDLLRAVRRWCRAEKIDSLDEGFEATHETSPLRIEGEADPLSHLVHSLSAAPSEPSVPAIPVFRIQPTPQEPIEQPKPGRALAAADLLDRQLAALFGSSLFGDWLNPGTWAVTSRRRRRSIFNLRRLVVLLVVAALSIGISLVLREGLSRHERAVHDRAMDDMRELLATGDMARIAQMLPALEPTSEELTSTDPHQDLISRVEATLYRYHDADPARLARVETSPPTGRERPTYDQVVTRALLRSRAERLDMLAALRGVDSPDNRDPEAPFLIGTALDRGGDKKKAGEALSHAEDLGSYHLPHLYEVMSFNARMGNKTKAQRVLDTMIDQNPRSVWVQIAHKRFGLSFSPSKDPNVPLPQPLRIPTSSPKAEPISPVALAELSLLESQYSLAKGDPKAARMLLEETAKSIKHQAPFLLDVFELLLEEGRLTQARLLLESGNWPRERPAARAAEGRLLLAEGRPADAQVKLLEAWRQGFHDPVAGLDLATVLGENSSVDVTPVQILAELVRDWPLRLDLEVDYARWLSESGEVDQAAQRINNRLDEIVELASKPDRAKAFLVLARFEASLGNVAKAKIHLKRSLQWDRANRQASTLLDQIVEDEQLAKLQQAKPPPTQKKRRR